MPNNKYITVDQTTNIMNTLTNKADSRFKLNTLTGLLTEGEIGEDIDTEAVSVSTLPYYFHQGSAVIMGNEIHILGGELSYGNPNAHYKWDGSNWSKVSTIPIEFFSGSAVVVGDEIHILGGYNDTYHCKWDGSSWTLIEVPIPYNFYRGSAVVYNNEIHILGSNSLSNNTKHYKWDGSSWTSVSTLPYAFTEGSAVVLNGEIHILGGMGNYTKHYKWDGTSWSEVGALPYNFDLGSAVVLNGEIHILGSNDSANYTKHYKLSGSSWSEVSTLPYDFYDSSAVVLNNEIHILGGNGNYTKHYRVEKLTIKPGWLPVYDEEDPSVLLFYFQTANVEGLSEGDIVIVSFDPSEMSIADLPNLAKSQIYCVDQHDNSLDFIAYKMPDFDIPITATIQGGSTS